ncbi:MAG: LEA type 2 family protein [Blastocatellia bacterium]
MKTERVSSFARLACALTLCAIVFQSSAPAQNRRSASRYGEKLIRFNVSEITLESIDFRNQTAHLELELEISNPLPVKLKDFDYSLRLYGLETVAGNYDGEMRIGGKDVSRISLPVELNLRSIPGAIWSAFKNRGRLKFDLDTAFTLPLFIFEKRFDKSFSGEVPLKSLVDAATLLRASRLGF